MTVENISFDCIKTEEQAAALSMVLGDIINMEFELHVTFSTIQQTYPLETIEISTLFFEQNTVDVTKKETLISFAKEAKDILLNFPVISCTIAFHPNAPIIDFVYTKIKGITQKLFLLDFIEDPTVIAGIQFSLRGKFYDYSIKKAAETALQKFV